MSEIWRKHANSTDRDSEQLQTVVRTTKLTRFAVGVTIYLLVALAQCLINVLIVERALADHFRSFMDLCSMCNISVMALTQANHGYYIHGRSVHGYSDVNMKQINDMLQRERVRLFDFITTARTISPASAAWSRAPSTSRTSCACRPNSGGALTRSARRWPADRCSRPRACTRAPCASTRSSRCTSR